MIEIESFSLSFSQASKVRTARITLTIVPVIYVRMEARVLMVLTRIAAVVRQISLEITAKLMSMNAQRGKF